MRLILTGVTGVAGLAAYRAALVDPAIDGVTLLTRRPVPSWAKLPPQAVAKTNTILHQDFKTYPADLAQQLAEHDGLVWALGKSSVGMSEEQYTELAYNYTLSAARALKEAGAGSEEKPFRFVYVSGEHADPTGESRQAWARVKGRVERELPELFQGTHMKAYILRPGYFFPSKAYPEDRLNQRSFTLRALDAVFGPVLGTLMPSSVVPTEELGRFMIELAKGRFPDQELFRNAEMRKLVKEL
ncbi:hypothetical protein TRAPUB_5486 [Trametes pubescens]|uniref:NAD(P)-binding domain-containing protein n=1 Tax=Trametes pubescens TaxID=154538 RepID=A0A1M2W726_TRAPU|nr:hypothetical protein TRAPUB_5486 [Trametes pubescens]